MTAPSVFTIPAGVSFVDTLAQGVMRDIGGDPFALSDCLILLPNRRACRALRKAFCVSRMDARFCYLNCGRSARRTRTNCCCPICCRKSARRLPQPYHRCDANCFSHA